MKIRFATGVCIATALLAGHMEAQEQRTAHFSGQINDYSPSTVSGGPYEMRGQWSLDVDSSGKGSFSADLNMETSDYGITGATQVDPANPTTRSAHTHHVTLNNASVSYDGSACPANSPATTGAAVVISGTVTVSANGGPAPFESNGASQLQVCITGGSRLSFSNLTLVYTGAASMHFGPQPIHGVVSFVSTR